MNVSKKQRDNPARVLGLNDVSERQPHQTLITLNHIKYFIAAADSSSFSQASKQEYISPATISKSVSYLERELKGPLFHRNHDGLQLTGFGEFFYSQACEIVRAFSNLDTLSSDYLKSSVKTGSLIVAVADYPARCSIINTPIQDFNEPYPGIKLEVSRTTNRSSLAAVEDMSADAALVVGAMRKESIDYLKLYERGVYAVIDGSSPLSGKATIAVAELVGYTMPSADDMGYDHDYFMRLFKSVGEVPKTANVSPTIEAHREFLSYGGVILSMNGPELALNYPGAHIVPLVNPHPVTMSVYLAWHSDNQNPALSSLRLWIKGAMHE